MSYLRGATLLALLVVPMLLGGCCGASHTQSGRKCDPFCLLRHDLESIWPEICDTSALAKDCRDIRENACDTSDLRQTLVRMHEAACCPECPEEN